MSYLPPKVFNISVEKCAPLFTDTICSVVVDQCDFDKIVDELAHIHNLVGNKLTNGMKYIPLIYRGTKTEFLFSRFGCEGKYMTVIVRGHGPELIKQMLGE